MGCEQLSIKSQTAFYMLRCLTNMWTDMHKTSLQWMELVDRLVLVRSLQVQLDLLDQR